MARLRNTTAAVTLAEQITESPEITNRRVTAGGVALYTASASPSNQTIEIQTANSLGTLTGSSEAVLCILELIDSVDIWASSTGQSTVSSTTWTAKSTLSWTPPSQGDYLSIYSAEGAVLVGGGSCRLRMNVNSGTFVNVHDPHGFPGALDWQSYVGAYRHTAVSGAQTAVMEFASDSASTVYIRNAYGVALRLDEFDNRYWAEDRTVHTSTSSTYADSATVIATPAAVDHLIIALGQATENAGGNASGTGQKINAAESDVGTLFHCSVTDTANSWATWYQITKRTEAASSTTWKTQYARVFGTATSSSDEHVLAVLQLVADVATTTTRLAPDAIAASTNLSTTLANIQDDPDSPDGSWLTATSATAATDVRVTFPTPTGSPYGAQNFRYLLRKTTGTPDPTFTAELRQNNTLRKTLASGTAVTSTTGTVFQGDWAASDLVTTTDGSDVECRIVSVVGLAAQAGALPAYAAVGTAETNVTMPATFNVAVPAHSNGNLLVLHVLTRNTNNDGVLASINTGGWSQGGGTGTAYGGANNARSGFGWKIGDGSETQVNVTTTGGTTTDRRLSRVYVFSAANGFSNPPVINIATATAGSGLSASMPTVATTSGGNMLAVSLISSASNTTVAAATGETGGNWTEPVAESAGTNGTIAIQVSDQSASSSISGGTAALGTTGNWVVIGFALNPADTGGGSAVNTVEIGAIEWNAQHVVVAGILPPFAMSPMLTHLVM